MDPEFGPGWAYFVNEEKYQEEIAKHMDVIEVRSSIFLSQLRFQIFPCNHICMNIGDISPSNGQIIVNSSNVISLG